MNSEQNFENYASPLHFFFFFGRIRSMCKFLGQGANLCHSSDPSHNSDNAGFLMF